MNKWMIRGVKTPIFGGPPTWKLKTDPSERELPFRHLRGEVPCYLSGEYLGTKVIDGRIKVAILDLQNGFPKLIHIP